MLPEQRHKELAVMFLLQLFECSNCRRPTLWQVAAVITSNKGRPVRITPHITVTPDDCFFPRKLFQVVLLVQCAVRRNFRKTKNSALILENILRIDWKRPR